MADTKTALAYDAKVLDFIETTGAILEKSSAMLADKEAQDSKCSKLIPAAVDALIANGRIEPHEKEAALAILKDPAKVLEVLTKTAQHRNDVERAQLGTPEGKGQTKKADYNSQQDGYVGRRARPGEAESDKAFKRGLGF